MQNSTQKMKKSEIQLFNREFFLAIFDEKIEIRGRCKGVHCVDLGESFPTSIYLQKSASIQPRTSPSKFGGKIQFNIHFTPYSLLINPVLLSVHGGHELLELQLFLCPALHHPEQPFDELVYGYSAGVIYVDSTEDFLNIIHLHDLHECHLDLRWCVVDLFDLDLLALVSIDHGEELVQLR